MTGTALVRALALAAIVASQAAAEDYRLQPGDTLEVSVAGLADYANTVTINLDGNVSLPLVGALAVAGSTVEEVRSALRGILPSKALTRRIHDGTEVQSVIDPDEIVVRVTEYRPIYVGGDVDQPGAQAFQPGKTARQALVDAGGFNILRSRVVDPILAHADLQAEREALHLELKRLRLARTRVEAEIEGRSSSSIGGDASDPLMALSREELDARLEAREREQLLLAQSQGHLQDRIRFLHEQLDNEQGAAEADAENEARIRSLVEQGISSQAALVDARRETLASTARAREVRADIAQTQRDLSEVVRNANQIKDTRRVQLLQEAQQLTNQISVETARLQAVGESLLYLGGVGTQRLSMGSRDFLALVFRDRTDGPVEVGLDSPLRPGDVVEIRIVKEALGRLLGTGESPPSAPRSIKPRCRWGRSGARLRRR